jgi:hypothetical protein
LEDFKLRSKKGNFANLNNQKLKGEINALKSNIDTLRQERMQMEYQRNLKIDLHHRARMDREICIYLLKMARSSKHKQIRKEGKKLLKLIKGL